MICPECGADCVREDLITIAIYPNIYAWRFVCPEGHFESEATVLQEEVQEE